MNLSWLQLFSDKFAYYVSNEKLLVKDHRLVEIRGIDPFFYMGFFLWMMAKDFINEIQIL